MLVANQRHDKLVPIFQVVIIVALLYCLFFLLVHSLPTSAGYSNTTFTSTELNEVRLLSVVCL